MSTGESISNSDRITNIDLPNSISKDELKQIIVDAVLEINQKREKIRQEQQEKINNGIMTPDLLKLFLSIGFFGMGLAFLAFSIFQIVNIFYLWFESASPWYMVIVQTVPFLVYAGLCMIVSWETSRIKDHNYLFSLFACIMSLASVILAFIAVMKVWL